MSKTDADEGVRKSKEEKKKKRKQKEGAGDKEEEATAGDKGDKAARKAAKKAKRDREAAEAAAGGGDEKAGESDKAARKAAKKAKKAAAAGGAASEAAGGFSAADFSPKLRAALEKAFPSPTAIQAQSWPHALAGTDLVAVAKTGSGKTLAFLLPAFHAITHRPPPPSGGPGPRVMVLAPTRELASQIQAEAEKFGPLCGVSSAVLYGGVPLPPQLKALQSRPGIVVATPGRLCDLMDRGAVKLGGCDYVVLDEADRMLDMGFEPQIKQIFGALPTPRQTLFFTATWPKAIRKLAATFLRTGDEVAHIGTTGEDAELAANKAVSQTFVQAQDDEKDNKLWGLLEGFAEGSRVVVFANTKRRVDIGAKNFAEIGSVAIHGDKTQAERERALAQFVRNECPLMFATDVAARGLDIKGVTHVINFDMARDVESYVHRIGRTGRAGELGASITFWNPDYDKECTPALCKIARAAGQEVPEWLAKYEKNKANKSWKVETAEAALGALKHG